MEAIVFLGRCGLPLRGQSDSGHPLTSTIDQSVGFNEGNFRALLHLMATCGDEIMNKHIQTCSRNAAYTSWSSQNELIEAIGAVLTKKIVAEINAAKFFTLVADETIDCSGAEQLSICLRFVKDGKIYERLLQLVEATDLSGAGIPSQLLNILRNVEINPFYDWPMLRWGICHVPSPVNTMEFRNISKTSA